MLSRAAEVSSRRGEWQDAPPSDQAVRGMRLDRGSRLLAGRAAEAAPQGRRPAPAAVPPHVPDAEAAGRPARRRLPLLGHQGPRAGASAPRRHRRGYQGGWHPLLPPGSEARAGARASHATAPLPGLALSRPRRGTGGSGGARPRRHRRHAATAQEAAGGTGPDIGPTKAHSLAFSEAWISVPTANSAGPLPRNRSSALSSVDGWRSGCNGPQPLRQNAPAYKLNW